MHYKFLNGCLRVNYSLRWTVRRQQLGTDYSSVRPLFVLLPCCVYCFLCMHSAAKQPAISIINVLLYFNYYFSGRHEHTLGNRRSRAQVQYFALHHGTVVHCVLCCVFFLIYESTSTFSLIIRSLIAFSLHHSLGLPRCVCIVLSILNIRRRLVRRIYIPLPDADSRRALIAHLLSKQGASGADMLQGRNLDKIVRLTEGYSGSDLTAVSAVISRHVWKL